MPSRITNRFVVAAGALPERLEQEQAADAEHEEDDRPDQDADVPLPGPDLELPSHPEPRFVATVAAAV